MSETAPRRLVNKKRYIQIMGVKLSLLTLSVGFLIGAIFAALTVLSALICLFCYPGETAYTWMGCRLGTVSISLLLLFSIAAYRKSARVEIVERITSQNAHLLPPEETLVRASTLAPSQYEAELLRAAQSGKETPVEEILRAGQPNDQR